jgi:hypothetical protein
MLHVGLSSWIVQDGNYGDFAVGQQARFALEFYPPNGLRPAGEGPLTAEHLGASRYRIHGRVVFVGPGVWAIDTGVFVAFEERQPPDHTKVGGWVEGELYLGIDPFFYFGYLYRIDGMPPLMYTWQVRTIIRETTPWVEVNDANGRPYRTRDESRKSFVPVIETRAWDDDGGNGHYVLGCESLGGPERPAT